MPGGPWVEEAAGLGWGGVAAELRDGLRRSHAEDLQPTVGRGSSRPRMSSLWLPKHSLCLFWVVIPTPRAGEPSPCPPLLECLLSELPASLPQPLLALCLGFGPQVVPQLSPHRSPCSLSSIACTPGPAKGSRLPWGLSPSLAQGFLHTSAPGSSWQLRFGSALPEALQCFLPPFAALGGLCSGHPAARAGPPRVGFVSPLLYPAWSTALGAILCVPG